MTTPPSPARELAEILGSLRAVMAEERAAVARLDHDAVDALTERKHAIVAALERVPAGPLDGETRRLVARTRLELAANAALINTARDGISALLGHTPGVGYDRRAHRYSESQSLRIITL